jgi:hypothetical protein
MCRSRGFLVCGLILGAVGSLVAAQPRSYRLPAVDLKQRVIWGATCAGPDGMELAFGGEDQQADDGRPHTRLKVDGEWKAIYQELRTRNPLQKYHEQCEALGKLQKDTTARARLLYFKGLPAADGIKQTGDLLMSQEKVNEKILFLALKLSVIAGDYKGYEAEQVGYALAHLQAALKRAKAITAASSRSLTVAAIQGMNAVRIDLEKAAEALDAEPPPRALSPVVYDAASKRFVLFGGDHLDYLTNDTWIFDTVGRKWQQRHPASAPPPRANHTLKAGGDGKVSLSGGYTYTSNTDYMGGQYRDLADGDWTYDIAANTWTGRDKGVPSDTRVYRTGPFDPDYYLQGARPDAAAFAEWLRAVPANTWMATKPPYLPQLNRDWGTAVHDPQHDLILRWSGGHCAHGGSDVLHYHQETNRWELPIPVEFPLGQLYSNTSYPDGFNFNRRPWITGHTYQSYGYESHAAKMIFTGRPRHFYLYDPAIGEWTGRAAKPRGMSYDSCFYTLTICPTPRGLVTWTREGRVFRLDAARMEWIELEQKGGKLPGAVVDNSTVVFDAKRNRLVFARKGYGDKAKYDGELHTLDLTSGTVGKLSPRGQSAASALSYLCQIRYDPDQDLMVVGATLPPVDGLRRTPAYDCAGNRWVSLKIGGDDPSGKTGRNVSLGLMHDAKRKLFWAVDTHSNVYVLRLDAKTADVRPLE